MTHYRRPWLIAALAPARLLPTRSSPIRSRSHRVQSVFTCRVQGAGCVCVWFNRPLPAGRRLWGNPGPEQTPKPAEGSPRPKRKQSCGRMRAEESLIALLGWICYVLRVPRQSACWSQTGGLYLHSPASVGMRMGAQLRSTPHQVLLVRGCARALPRSQSGIRDPPSPRRPFNSHTKERSHEQSSQSPQDQLS